MKECSFCEGTNRRLEQHEQTITQLLAMVAVSHKQLNELSSRQEKLELESGIYIQPSPRLVVANTTPQLPTNTPYQKE